MKKLLITLSITMLFVLCAVISVSAATFSVEVEDFANNGGFAVSNHASASGGKYMTGTTTNAADHRSVASVGPTELEYKLNITQEGNYSVYLRLANPAAYNGDSIWVAVDDQFYACHFGVDHLNFYWKKVALTKFTPGEHVIRIWSREQGAMVDKLVISNDPLYAPEGMGEPPAKESVLYNNGAGNIAAPLPATVPPNEHPRLLIRKADLPKVKANLNHPQNAKVYERVLRVAESKHKGDQSSYNADLLEVMMSKAFLYMVNGDVEKGKEAVEMVMNHIGRLTIATGFANDTTMRSAGHVIFATACIYDWCYDLFTPEQRQQYIKRCEDIITYNFEGGYPITEAPDIATTEGHRVENPIYKDLLAFGVAIYDEQPFTYNNVVGILNMNYYTQLNWYYPSHWMPQGVSVYGDFRYVWEVFSSYIMDTLGQKPVSYLDQRDTLYKSIYWRRPDGAYLMDSDDARKSFNGTYIKNYHSLYFISANMCKDPAMKWQYYKNLGTDEYTSTGYTAVNAPMYLLINDVDVAIDNTLQLPLTKYYPSPVGVMMARTSWEEGYDSPAVMVSMKPQETYFSQHSHVEVGSFQVYYKGALALDSGAYEAPSYVKDDGTVVPGSEWGSGHYASYASRPVAHNVLLIYDPNKPDEIYQGGQRLGFGATSSWRKYSEVFNGSHKTGENIAYDFGPDKNIPEYSYIEGNLAPGYREDRVKAYTRSYMFLNLFDDEVPAAFIVLDRMQASEAGLEKAWLLHSQEEPRVEGNKITIDRTEFHNSGRLTNTVLMPNDYVIEKVGGPGKEYWNGTTNLEIYRQEVGDESGTWRVEIKPAEKRLNDYFLNVMQVSDPDDNIKHHEVKSNEQGEFLGIFIADRAVFMKKNAGLVYKEFTVTAEGEGDISYIITNLAEGKWTVKDAEGNVVASELVSGEHGVLRFRTKPGTYNVSWQYAYNVEPKTFSIVGDSIIVDYRPVSVFVNDKNYNATGRLENGVVMMALDDMAKLTNRASFNVEGNNYNATGAYGTISGTVGSADAIINGAAVKLSVPAIEADGKVYLPLQDLKSVYEFTYTYDDLTYVLYFRGGYYMVPGANYSIINVEDSNRADIMDVTASGYNTDANHPLTSLDNNYSTYWTIGGKGQWIQYELAEAYEVTGVGLAWASGNIRQEHFAIHVSEDGVNWTEMWRGDSSGKTAQIEDFMFDKPIKAKYVKLECNENTVNMMNSLTEAQVYCVNKVPYYEK